MQKLVLFLVAILSVSIAKSQTIDIISYNIRYDNPDDAPNNWDNRKDFLISQLNFYNPDVWYSRGIDSSGKGDR